MAKKIFLFQVKTYFFCPKQKFEIRISRPRESFKSLFPSPQLFLNMNVLLALYARFKHLQDTVTENIIHFFLFLEVAKINKFYYR